VEAGIVPAAVSPMAGKKKETTMKWSQWLMLGVLVVLASVGCGGGGKDTPRLEGAGSSFIDPMMQVWAKNYYKGKNVQVNYQSTGSGAGINKMTAKEVDFGCSDAPLNAEQLSKAESAGGEVLHLQLCMGGIVPAYNLAGIKDLTFSGQVLIDIYLGRIKKWNDEAIGKLNPGVKLPEKEIAVAFRSDSSGSTYIFTDFLTKINEQAWTPGKSTAVKFPVGTGAKNNDGVAGFVKNNDGAIGYIELIYALENNIAFGKVLNASGKAIKADLKSVTAAAATAKIPDDLRYSITNAPGDDSYPIAGTVWALVFVKQPSDKAESLKDFLTWITHEGQKHCEKLHYAALPQTLVLKIEAKFKKIQASK
jgi:phosphate ABC transporter phosphate-binding protein